MRASTFADAYGVAGSLTVPITSTGGAPAARTAGSGSRGARHCWQVSRPSASELPNSGYCVRHG